MPSCDNFVIWRNIPKGATLQASAGGDSTKYDVVIRTVCDDGSVTLWHRGDLDPGPASMPLPMPDSCTSTITVSIFNDTDVTVEMSVDDGHSCSWSFSSAGGHQVEVELLP